MMLGLKDKNPLHLDIARCWHIRTAVSAESNVKRHDLPRLFSTRDFPGERFFVFHFLGLVEL